jgi:hypothetical protein
MNAGIFSRRRRLARDRERLANDKGYGDRIRLWAREYSKTERGKKKHGEWEHKIDLFADKHCVICGKLLSYRTVKFRLCKQHWIHEVHPMLMRIRREEKQASHL